MAGRRGGGLGLSASASASATGGRWLPRLEQCAEAKQRTYSDSMT